MIAKCKECDKEYNVKFSDKLSNFECECGGELVKQINLPKGAIYLQEDLNKLSEEFQDIKKISIDYSALGIALVLGVFVGWIPGWILIYILYLLGVPFHNYLLYASIGACSLIIFKASYDYIKGKNQEKIRKKESANHQSVDIRKN